MDDVLAILITLNIVWIERVDLGINPSEVVFGGTSQGKLDWRVDSRERELPTATRSYACDYGISVHDFMWLYIYIYIYIIVRKYDFRLSVQIVKTQFHNINWNILEHNLF